LGLLAGPAGQLGVDGGELRQDRDPRRGAWPGQGQAGGQLAAGALQFAGCQPAAS